MAVAERSFGFERADFVAEAAVLSTASGLHGQNHCLKVQLNH